MSKMWKVATAQELALGMMERSHHYVLFPDVVGCMLGMAIVLTYLNSQVNLTYMLTIWEEKAG